jgi:hypothetical protein
MKQLNSRKLISSAIITIVIVACGGLKVDLAPEANAETPEEKPVSCEQQDLVESAESQVLGERPDLRERWDPSDLTAPEVPPASRAHRANQALLGAPGPVAPPAPRVRRVNPALRARWLPHPTSWELQRGARRQPASSYVQWMDVRDEQAGQRRGYDARPGHLPVARLKDERE